MASRRRRSPSPPAEHARLPRDTESKGAAARVAFREIIASLREQVAEVVAVPLLEFADLFVGVPRQRVEHSVLAAMVPSVRIEMKRILASAGVGTPECTLEVAVSPTELLCVFVHGHEASLRASATRNLANIIQRVASVGELNTISLPSPAIRLLTAGYGPDESNAAILRDLRPLLAPRVAETLHVQVPLVWWTAPPVEARAPKLSEVLPPEYIRAFGNVYDGFNCPPLFKAPERMMAMANDSSTHIIQPSKVGRYAMSLHEFPWAVLRAAQAAAPARANVLHTPDEGFFAFATLGDTRDLPAWNFVFALDKSIDQSVSAVLDSARQGLFLYEPVDRMLGAVRHGAIVDAVKRCEREWNARLGTQYTVSIGFSNGVYELRVLPELVYEAANEDIVRVLQDDVTAIVRGFLRDVSDC